MQAESESQLQLQLGMFQAGLLREAQEQAGSVPDSFEQAEMA